MVEENQGDQLGNSAAVQENYPHGLARMGISVVERNSCKYGGEGEKVWYHR